MSLLQSALSQTLPRVPQRLDELSALIEPSWIEQALASSGKASIRRRKLPAEHAIWLVIGLALFRNQPLWQVAWVILRVHLAKSENTSRASPSRDHWMH